MSTHTQATSVATPAIFHFNDQQIRILPDENGNPWFCGPDVCKILGYINAPKAITDHCREAGITKRYIRSGNQSRELTFLNEGNLYRLILKSHKPEAERFEAWVCDEILPQIRKTGRYTQPTTDDYTNHCFQDPLARWILSCEGGEPKLQRIKRYSLLIEPKYLFVLVDAAREAKSAVYKIE